MLWVRFDFGSGKFIEKEFAIRNDIYEYLDDHPEIVEWCMVRPPTEPKVKEIE
jgi:hypothetical protein